MRLTDRLADWAARFTRAAASPADNRHEELSGEQLQEIAGRESMDRLERRRG